jgi:hypothetical protein
MFAVMSLGSSSQFGPFALSPFAFFAGLEYDVMPSYRLGVDIRRMWVKFGQKPPNPIGNRG